MGAASTDAPLLLDNEQNEALLLLGGGALLVLASGCVQEVHPTDVFFDGVPDPGVGSQSPLTGASFQKPTLHCRRPPNALAVTELNRQFNNSTFSDVGKSAKTVSEYVVYLASINADLPVGSKKTESEIAVKLLLCFDDPGYDLGVLALSELLAPEGSRRHWKPAVVAGPGVLARPASRDLQGVQRRFEPLWRAIYVYDASLLLLDVRDWITVCTPGGSRREGASSAAPPQLSRAALRSVCPNTPHAAANQPSLLPAGA